MSTIGVVIVVVCLTYQTWRIISLKGKLTRHRALELSQRQWMVKQSIRMRRLTKQRDKARKNYQAAVSGMSAFFLPEIDG